MHASTFTCTSSVVIEASRPRKSSCPNELFAGVIMDKILGFTDAFTPTFTLGPVPGMDTPTDGPSQKPSPRKRPEETSICNPCSAYPASPPYHL